MGQQDQFISIRPSIGCPFVKRLSPGGAVTGKRRR
jgi:hypothetical protein